ncbi:MAG: tRNA pseudouridine(13) synthase TruD, partial [Spirochaetales bacterium]|nr:tRNA pseudouridine(13) synthase TruD [Spirochaetales bacterium]
MKIKVRPEDFQVREQAAIGVRQEPDRYAVFSLAKSQWDTFDLVDLLARRLRVAKSDISFGGIKDRFGATEQLISVRVPAGSGRAASGPRGWREKPEDRNFSLRFLGYSPEAITARSIAGNHFTITLRDMDPREAERCREGAQSIRQWGVPNYYDEQRFGSARHGKGFMGKEIFLGRRKQALQLYFEPS